MQQSDEEFYYYAERIFKQLLEEMENNNLSLPEHIPILLVEDINGEQTHWHLRYFKKIPEGLILAYEVH